MVRIIKIPVRVIRRKNEPVPTNPLCYVVQMFTPYRLFHRLCGEPHIVADIFRWLAFEMRKFTSKLSSMLVETPCQRWQPGKNRTRSAPGVKSETARKHPPGPYWRATPGNIASARSSPRCSTTASRRPRSGNRRSQTHERQARYHSCRLPQRSANTAAAPSEQRYGSSSRSARNPCARLHLSISAAEAAPSS